MVDIPYIRLTIKIGFNLLQILHLSCQVQSLPSFQAPCPCNVLRVLQTQTEVSFLHNVQKCVIKQLLNVVFA